VLLEAFGILLRTLYPAAPHIAHALWVGTGLRGAATATCFDAPWPEVDEDALVQDRIELMLQVSGKLRGAIRVPADADRTAIEAAALAAPEFLRFAEGKAAKKVDRGAGPARQRGRLMIHAQSPLAAAGHGRPGAGRLRLPAAPAAAPGAFASIALTGFAPRRRWPAELREQHRCRQVRVLEAPDKADVVLHALEDQRDRSVGGLHGLRPRCANCSWA
jgi:leucyl-tRNA synthetase